jgi:hypothetical protein
MRHQEIVTSTTPWLGSASWAKPDGDMSTTRGYPASSRSSTTHVVLAPVAVSVTVTTVPKGSVGLAQRPGGASAYHVACPLSLSPGAGAGAAVGATVCATTGAVVTGAVSGRTGATVVVVVGGTVVVVVVGAGTAVVVVAASGVEE